MTADWLNPQLLLVFCVGFFPLFFLSVCVFVCFLITLMTDDWLNRQWFMILMTADWLNRQWFMTLITDDWLNLQ